MRFAWMMVCLVACEAAPRVAVDAAMAPGDADGDTIADRDEGGGATDTDGDGTPDLRDTDSDGDGLPDAFEAGDADLATPPVDSDGDGTPDFRDLDSDDNGRADRLEGAGDADGDGTPDAADPDDDGDLLLDVEELGPTATDEQPRDSDGDGVPDFRDQDADGDGILDRDEGSADPDGDGLGNYLDLDSDGDGLVDAVEAGDGDLETPPVDTDGDGTPDVLDLDSDDDGLVDDLEAAEGTSPTRADTDDDGVTDLIERAAGSDPRDPEESPRTRGDFVFVVPFEGDPDPPVDTLAFRSSIRAADVYFSFDTSTTMAAEAAALRSATTGVPAIIDALRCAESGMRCDADADCTADEVCAPEGRCVESPALEGCLVDLYTGVGRWKHIDSFQNLVTTQADPAVTAAAIPPTPDFWVAPVQAVACVADGASCLNDDRDCAPFGVGCPGFRESAVRILVQITDANDECLCGFTGFPCDVTDGDPPRCALFTAAGAGAALAAQQIQFIGLIGEGTQFGVGESRALAAEIGRAAGSVDAAGEPFVYDATDAAVVDQTVRAVRDIVTESRFDYAITAREGTGDDGDALPFIERFEAQDEGPGCTDGLERRDGDGDGFDDVFVGVQPGQQVCWDVVVRPNDRVEPLRTPQVFRARLSVRADGSEVDARVVYFLVPADTSLPPIR